MIIHKCDRCNKIFKQKCHLIDHKNRKKPCTEFAQILPEICPEFTKKNNNTETKLEFLFTQNKKSYVCRYCNTIFASNRNLQRHITDRCHIKKQHDDEKEEIFNELLKKLDKLEKSNEEIIQKNKLLEQQVAKISHRKHKTIVNNSNNTHNIVKDNVVNSNNTFVLVGCGNEDIMKLDKKKIIRAVGAGFYSTHRLTDLVHFDPDHPEYAYKK